MSREKGFENVVSDLTKKIAYVSTKLVLEKSERKKYKKKKYIYIKNYENIYNLHWILGTKLVLLVDFWDHIFKTIFPKHFFLFSILDFRMSRNMCKLRRKVRNGQSLPHKCPNFTNYFFQSNKSETTLPKQFFSK